MKKKLLMITVIALIGIMVCSCGGSTKKIKTALHGDYAFVKIDKIPDGWSDISGYYVYEIDTKIIYIMTTGVYDTSYVKLESEDYEAYKYENNKFVGFNR